MTYNPYANQRGGGHGSRVIVRNSANHEAETKPADPYIEGINLLLDRTANLLDAAVALSNRLDEVGEDARIRADEQSARIDELVDILGEIDRRLT